MDNYMITNVIALYPGRFQPFSKHHATAFKWLQKQFGAANTYIVTSNVVQLPKSPFSFSEKQDIIRQYGLDDRLVQVKKPYNPEEILAKLDPETTAVVFMVGDKDMKEDPRFSFKPKKDGSDSYFQPYDSNKRNLQGFDKHGYLITAPHVSMKIPKYGEISGTVVRKALGEKIPRSNKIDIFKSVFGWYNEKLANMIFDKMENLNEQSLFGKEWWTQSLHLNEDPCWSGYKQVGMKKKGKKTVPNCVPVREGYMSAKVQAKHDAKIEKLKKFLRQHIGQEFVYNFNEFPKTVYGVSREDLQESLILEGGASGHMSYVFDLPNVKTGNDIIKALTLAAEHITANPVPVKIDGLNTDVRMVVLDGKRQFVMDRGTKKDLDVKGLTKSDLESRFGAGHGMIKIGGEVLDMFNEVIPIAQSELKKLGLFDNPNILLNIEYVAGGKSNIIAYTTNKFLAIHNLLELYPTETGARKTKRIAYDKNALESLIQKMLPIAKKHGYMIYGTVPAKAVKSPDINKVLNQTISIPITDDKSVRKTLKSWLQSLTIPKNVKVTWNNVKEPAISKRMFNAIYTGTPIAAMAKNKDEYKTIIDGYITFLSAMLISQEILDNLTSDIGSLADQEGVVINDLSPYPQFKIVGKFITKKPGEDSATFKATKESITEGGNVFKSPKGEHLTTRIKREKVIPTVKELETITKLPLVDNMLGTAGKKVDSGDIDLAVNEKETTKSELESILKRWCISNDLDPKDYIKKSGDSVHFKAKIKGTDEFVQVDFMFGDPEWMRWALRGSSLESKYKAEHAHVLLASIAKYNNMKWSYKRGLLNRADNSIITRDPNQIAKTLLGPKYTAKDLDSVEQIMNALRSNPDRNEMIQDAKETLHKIYNVDISF